MAKAGQNEKPSTAMGKAWKLREAGDVLYARREAQKVLAGSPSNADAESARELLARSGFERATLMYAGICAAVILTLIVMAIVRS